jgi:hypothetical protein
MDFCLLSPMRYILVKAKPPNPKKRQAKVFDEFMTQIGQEALSKVTSKSHGISAP